MQYIYFVSYQYNVARQGGGESGFGHINVIFTERIAEYRHIIALQKFIEKETRFNDIVILNYNLLKKC